MLFLAPHPPEPFLRCLKNSWLTLAVGVCTLLFATGAWAAPFKDLRITFTQPDGSTVGIIGSGDEFSAVFETLHGYAVVFDPDQKAYCFAGLGPSGDLVSTGDQIHRANPARLGLKKHLRPAPAARQADAQARYERWEAGMGIDRQWKARKAALRQAEAAAGEYPAKSPPSYATTGTKVGLTLLIDFDDDPATIPLAEIIDFCNGDNYTGYANNGSVKQYFLDNSNGQLTYSNVVTIYIRIPNTLHPKSYYNDTTKDCGAQANLLIRDAISVMRSLPNYATEILPAFANLSTDSKKVVTACNVFYAGGNGGVWSKGLWPHSWSLVNVGAQDLSTGGKKVYNYQITNIGSSLAIGTFCHENGHMLCGYPDVYDYDYDSIGGAGYFCLMNSGNHLSGGKNPAQISAYLKRSSGWATTVALNSNSALVATVGVTSTNFNRFYRYEKPGVPTEYFLVECRNQSGRDASIPASGVAIWHVDELGDHNNQSLVTNSSHLNYELTLVQADNLWHFENNVNQGDTRDLYYLGNSASGYANRFSDVTAPGANWWNGTSSGISFQSFSSAGTTMTFVVGSGPVILTQPQDQVVAAGQSATFNVTAVGTMPLGYQWSFNGTNVAGATASAYTRLNVKASDVGDYRVAVTNTLGAATSSVASLNLLAAPTIAVQPQSAEVIAGQAAGFSVGVMGTPPLRYQWRHDGQALPGATNSALVFSSVQALDAGTYFVAVSNVAGSVTSSNAALVVYLPPAISAQPASVTTGLGLSATFSVAASGTPPLSYQWRFNGNNLPGATGASCSVSNLQAGDAGGYSVVVSNPYGTNSSSDAVLTVLDPFIVRSPSAQVARVGGAAQFDVQAVGTQPLAYQWLRHGANLAGEIAETLLVTNLQPSDMAYYQVTVSNRSGAQASAMAALILTDAPPVITTQPLGQSVRAGSTAAYTAAALGAEPLSWQWQRDGSNLAAGGDVAGQASPSLTISNAQGNDVADYTLVVSNAAGQVSSAAARLAIWPLVGWGQDNYSQAAIPAGLDGVVQLAAGYSHALALRQDGTVAAWGAGSNSTITSPHYRQAQVPAALSNVVSIACGGYHSLAVRVDGTVVAWGAGTTNTGISPNNGQSIVPGTLSNVIAVAGGFYHSLALSADGTVAAWGQNNYGQSDVPPFSTNVVAIASGNYHNLALLADGHVVAWGAGQANSGVSPHYGQSIVPPDLTNAVAVACGAYHSLALRADGTVVAWGAGVTNSGLAPHYGQAQPPPGLSNVVAVAGGFNHSLAVQADGSLVAWGANSFGQANALKGLTNVVALAGGSFFNLVLQGDNSPFLRAQPASQSARVGGTLILSVKALGTQPISCQWQHDGVDIAGATNLSLALGNVQVLDSGYYRVILSNASGSVTSLVASVALVDAPPFITRQPAGFSGPAGATVTLDAAALGTPPLSYSWRRNSTNLVDGGKINGAATATLSVSDLQGGEMGSYSLVVSNAYGMAVSGEALVAVWPFVGWGLNNYGQADIPPNLTNIAALAAGYAHSMALRADGTVVAWGAGTNNTASSPHFGQVQVPADLTNVAAIACGGYHSLALREDGTVVAWGAGITNNGSGPNNGQSIVPVGLSNATAIAAGFYHSLALCSDGTVTAWGANSYGQTNVPADLTNVAAVACGTYHNLALRADGTVVGWGAGMTNSGVHPHYGQSIVPPDLGNVVAIACGGHHSLAVRQDGSLVAWGAGVTNAGVSPHYGQAQVPAVLTNVAMVAGGFYHSIAVTRDGAVSAWGLNNNGQISVPAGLRSPLALAGGPYHTLLLQSDGLPLLLAAPSYLAAGEFGFSVSGTSGLRCRLEVSGDFVNWTPLATNTVPFTFTDKTGGGTQMRVYRAVRLL